MTYVDATAQAGTDLPVHASCSVTYLPRPGGGFPEAAAPALGTGSRVEQIAAVPAGALASLTPMMPSGVLLIYDPVAKTCSYAFAAPPSTRPVPPGSPGDVGWVGTQTRAARAFALRLADTLDRLGPATHRATPAFRKLPFAARRIPAGALRTGVRQLARGLPPALARPLRRSGSTPAELAGLRRAAGVATAAGAATTGPSTMAAAFADPDAQRLLARSALAMRCYRVVDTVLADATL